MILRTVGPYLSTVEIATIRKLFTTRTTSAESSALVVRNCHTAQLNRVYGPRSCNSNTFPSHGQRNERSACLAVGSCTITPIHLNRALKITSNQKGVTGTKLAIPPSRPFLRRTLSSTRAKPSASLYFLPLPAPPRCGGVDSYTTRTRKLRTPQGSLLY